MIRPKKKVEAVAVEAVETESEVRERVEAEERARVEAEAKAERERLAKQEAEKAYWAMLKKLDYEDAERKRIETARAEAEKRRAEEAKRAAMTEREKWIDTYRTIKTTVENLDAMANSSGRFMCRFYYAGLEKDMNRVKDSLRSKLYDCTKEMSARGIPTEAA